MQTIPFTTQNKSSKPLLSFIITYYNQPQTMLTACIESIMGLSLHQDEREIIVVDDGSADSPINYLLELDKDIKYIRQSNQGVSAARNTGLELSKGTYIQFVDADDYLFADSYNHCIDLIRQREIKVVAFDMSTQENPNTEAFKDEPAIEGNTLLHNQNIKGSICCYLFASSILHNLRFSEEIKYGEDEEFTPQMLLSANSVVVTTAKAYYYRQHEASAIHQMDISSIRRRLEDNLKVICRLNAKLDTMPYSERLGITRRLHQLTMDYLYNIMTLTKDESILNAAIARLSKEGLFPLPNKDYTLKYKLFRKAIATGIGRKVLLKILSH